MVILFELTGAIDIVLQLMMAGALHTSLLELVLGRLLTLSVGNSHGVEIHSRLHFARRDLRECVAGRDMKVQLTIITESVSLLSLDQPPAIPFPEQQGGLSPRRSTRTAYHDACDRTRLRQRRRLVYLSYRCAVIDSLANGVR